jgi:hypothetical protein
MSWEDYHLHEFEMLNPNIGNFEMFGTIIDDYEDFGDGPLVPEKKVKISDILLWKIRLLYTCMILG